jgi:hypothetical protein
MPIIGNKLFLSLFHCEQKDRLKIVFCGLASGVFLDRREPPQSVAIPDCESIFGSPASPHDDVCPCHFKQSMLNYGRTKQSLFQEAREADRDTLHAVARDSVYRRRLGALAHKKDGTPASQAASAIVASFRTAGQIAENGMPKEKFENSVAVFYFVHDVPGTDDLADTSRLIEMAQIASLWYCRVADMHVSFTQFYPDVPLIAQTAFSLDFDRHVAAMHFNPDHTARKINWTNFAILTSEGAEVYSHFRAKFPQDAVVWAPTTGAPHSRKAILASPVFNTIPEPSPNCRHFSTLDPVFDAGGSHGMAAALQTEANSFKVIEPSFFAQNLADHCGRTHGRNPIEMLNAVVESVQRWFCDNQQHRLAPFSEKQIKSWVLADAGPRGTASTFSLENLIPKLRISTLGDLTNAVALFVEVEGFMRGSHMNIIADAFLNLVRVGQRRPNFGPRTMAMLLENRHMRLRAPIRIAAIGPTTQFSEADLADEAFERARAAFRFESTDRDLREAKDDPLHEESDHVHTALRAGADINPTTLGTNPKARLR